MWQAATSDASAVSAGRYGLGLLSLSLSRTVEQMEKEFFQHMRPSSLLKRFETVEEIAHMVTYLCSPLASGTTGAAVRVDGGVVRAI